MTNKNQINRDLAISFVNSCGKDNIIPAIFDYFNIDCIERCSINPAELDNLIRKFNAKEGCDIDLITAIIDIIKTGKTNAQNKESELIKSIISYINENLNDDVSVEEIAQKLNISYYYMCHIFKNKYGISVNTYRTRKRLEKAMRMLIESEERISDIAINCAFSNVSYFTETFTKIVGVSPSEFRKNNKGVFLHKFYDFSSILLATKMPYLSFLDEKVIDLELKINTIMVSEADEYFDFLHEAAIIEYHGVLYASWYNCPKAELKGYTPICGKRSYDGGKTWSETEIICDDKTGKILYCPPVYGICDDKLYMMVNQMVAPDHIHSLDLYLLNNESGRFELLWSRPIPFKLNTNVILLPNGKLMLPGRVGELDGFPNTPAVIISDSGKIDAQWRLVKVAENGKLPDGENLVHPETTVIIDENTLYMFNRNDNRGVPIVYISENYGESWSQAYSHDIPYISSKIYAGNLSGGEKYLIANIDTYARSRLAIYFTDRNSNRFSKRIVLFNDEKTMCHYPCAYESNGKLYIIATKGCIKRGAILFIIDLKELKKD